MRQAYSPLVAVKVLEKRCVAAELDDVRRALHCKSEDGLSDRGDHGRILEPAFAVGPVDAAGPVAGENGEFANEDGHVLVSCGFVPVVKVIEPVLEKLGRFVVIYEREPLAHRNTATTIIFAFRWEELTKIPHCSRGEGCVCLRDGVLDRLTGDILDLWVFALQRLEEQWPSPVVAVTEPILVSNLNVFDAEGRWVAMLSAFLAPVCGFCVSHGVF